LDYLLLLLSSLKLISSYYTSSYLISFYSYLSYFLYRLPLFLFIRGLSLSLSTYLYVGYLSYVLYAFSLFSYTYMCCLSSYSYGGYPSYLLSTRAVFLPIRTGAILPTYFLHVLSFFLFVRGLSFLPTFYMCCLSSYSYGGYSFFLLSICAVFLLIRTGAISPTYFPRGLSTPFMLLSSNLYSNIYSNIYSKSNP
jgi:hypothetical protein